MDRRSKPDTTPAVDLAWRDRVHDLKNPLSAILANCQYLMAHGALNAADLDVMNDIAASARTLRRMLDEAARQLQPEPVEAHSLMLGNSAAGRAK